MGNSKQLGEYLTGPKVLELIKQSTEAIKWGHEQIFLLRKFESPGGIYVPLVDQVRVIKEMNMRLIQANMELLVIYQKAIEE